MYSVFSQHLIKAHVFITNTDTQMLSYKNEDEVSPRHLEYKSDIQKTVNTTKICSIKVCAGYNGNKMKRELIKLLRKSDH